MLNFKVYKSWTTGLVRFQVEFFKLELEIRLSSLQCLASGETFKMLEKNSLKLCGNCVLRTLQPRFNCSYFSGARLGPHSPALSTPKHRPDLHSPYFISCAATLYTMLSAVCPFVTLFLKIKFKQYVSCAMICQLLALLLMRCFDQNSG